MSWLLTVAAVIEHQGRFLMVEERDGDGPVVLNQPAGHVEQGESLQDALVREVREETGLAFTPESLVGVYQLRAANGRDYCRICFAGSVPLGQVPSAEDPKILGCRWFTRDEIQGSALRSGLVLRCLEDYEAGQRMAPSVASVMRTER